jgi:hypothetical protein
MVSILEDGTTGRTHAHSSRPITAPLTGDDIVTYNSAMAHSLKQEFFSRAYALAVISASGHNYSKPEIDLGIDFTISGTSFGVPSPFPSIHVQIKSTVLDRMDGTFFKYRLDRESYDRLRGPMSAPFLLVVVAVPRLVKDWLTASEVALTLRRCGYWISLAGHPPRDQQTITLDIPRSQRFSVQSLQGMMDALEQGGTFL